MAARPGRFPAAKCLFASITVPLLGGGRPFPGRLSIRFFLSLRRIDPIVEDQDKTRQFQSWQAAGHFLQNGTLIRQVF